MIDRIGGGGFHPLTGTLPERPDVRTPGIEGGEGPGFKEVLSDAVGRVEGAIAEANDAVSALASGEDVDLHGTMIALEKADIALRMTVSARDRFIGAYEQIMNMSL